MATLRELFHTIANWHNKITISAGYCKEVLTDKALGALTKEELKNQQLQLLEAFEKIENYAITANQKVTELKEALYKKIKPEEEISP